MSVVTFGDITNIIILKISPYQVRVYGREVTLTNCDAFTRSHLASEGVELAPVEPRPQDEYQVISSSIDILCRYNYTIYTISTQYLHYICTRAGWAEDLPSLGTGRAGHGCTSFITDQGDTVSRHV